MDPFWMLATVVLSFGAGLALGLALLRHVRAAAAQHEARAAAAHERVVALSSELAAARAALEAERRAAAERAAQAERGREQVRAEVELLAGRLLAEKGDAMLREGQAGLSALLQPVAERLRAFEAKVDRTYDQENRDRATLLASLQRLQEAQARLHAEAESLSRALTGDSKVQGDWGELVLERVLETAGLTEGREYDLQVSHADEGGGRKRPDALVYLPGDRVVVVDAKCSLTAFVEAMRAAGDDARRAALAAHVASLRAHARGLAAKSYPEVVAGRTVDLVLLFVPNEAAFHAALATEPGLYDEAFRQRIVLCSPTTLLAALQLVSHVWRTERQNVNAQKIAEEGGKLLEKLSAFVADLDGVGARLDQAQAAFQAARGKLATGRGNVLRKAAELVKLGARVRPDKVAALRGDPAEDDGPELLALAADAPPEESARPDAAPAA
jgi:DNA recombination protein RmuC